MARTGKDWKETARRRAVAISRAIVALALCAGAAPALACAPRTYDGVNFTVCSFDPRHDDIRLFWKGSDGKPYGAFSTLVDALKSSGLRLVFAMNAGMFKDDQSPVGLYVEKGRKLHDADTRAGVTNFHMKPNGVFWIGDGVAGVTETGRYLASPPHSRYATQSGPMLVVDGTILFAIADEPVTFDTFARFFRDGLGCKNALFLDGSVSSLYAPELERDDQLTPIGPIVGVVRPATK